jgi:hypothetical protein
MVGQCCDAQDTLAIRIGSRSAFASACGSLASTRGAKLGKIVMAVATKAAIVTAESALIMVRPLLMPAFTLCLQG